MITPQTQCFLLLHATEQDNCFQNLNDNQTSEAETESKPGPGCYLLIFISSVLLLQLVIDFTSFCHFSLSEEKQMKNTGKRIFVITAEKIPLSQKEENSS